MTWLKQSLALFKLPDVRFWPAVFLVGWVGGVYVQQLRFDRIEANRAAKEGREVLRRTEAINRVTSDYLASKAQADAKQKTIKNRADNVAKSSTGNSVCFDADSMRIIADAIENTR